MNNQVRIAINLSSRIPSIHTCYPTHCLLISLMFGFFIFFLSSSFSCFPSNTVRFFLYISIYTHRLYFVLLNYFFEYFSLCNGNLKGDIELYSSPPTSQCRHIRFQNSWIFPRNEQFQQIREERDNQEHRRRFALNCDGWTCLELIGNCSKEE